MRPTSQTRLAWLLLSLCGAAAAILLYFFDPAVHAFYPRCPLQSLAGLECPTCGGLRAAHLLLHGEFMTAYALNPFLFWSLPVAGLFLVRPVRARGLPWIALAALFAWFLWRNWFSAHP